MKKIITFFAALAAVLSCSKENPNNYNPVDGTYSVTLTASAPGADTKTTLVDGEENGKPAKFVHWSKGDAIKVLFFPNHTANSAFDAPSGVFNSNFTEESSEKALFKTDKWSWGKNSGGISLEDNGLTNMLMPTGIAVYPSSATAESKKAEGSYVPGSIKTNVSFSLPFEQVAAEDNISTDYNFSYAEVSLASFSEAIKSGRSTSLEFKNTCALIQLIMPDVITKKITSIAIKSESDVSLTGLCKMNFDQYENSFYDQQNISISGNSGLVLTNENGFQAGKSYYAVVWPGTHSSLIIEFLAEDGSVATKKTGKVSLTSSRVKPYSFTKGLDFKMPIVEYDYVYSDGSLGNDPNPSGKSVTGVIFFNGNPRENDPALPEYCTHGLAISLAPTSTKWQGSEKFPNTNFQNHGLSNTSANVWGYTAMLKWKELYDAKYLTIYSTNYGNLPSGKTSGWYHGTNCEWNIISKNIDTINEKLTACGETVLSVSYNNYYWTAVGSTASYMYAVKGFGVNGATYAAQSGLYAYPARPIFAF